MPLIKFKRRTQFKPNLSLLPNIQPISTQSVESQSSSVLEWWQIPSQYRRHGIDVNEIDQINSGGADQIFQ